MSEMEHKYYEDQKTERKMSCSKGVDPVWYHSMMRTQRLRERSEEYQRKRDQQFQYQTLDQITDMLIEAGEISSSSSDEGTTPKRPERQMFETDTHRQLQKEGEESEVRAEPMQRKKLFMDAAAPDMDEDPLPREFQHIRLSERKVREEFYTTIANLSGKGLSISEASSAVIEVGNTMFKRSWKSAGECDEIFDKDTVPSTRSIREALNQIEAQSLCLVVEKLEEKKEKGKMITHASDTTTKKGVGQFMVQGLHAGQDSPFPRML